MQRTVGREDRLVRGGIALSLAIMSAFGAIASGGIGYTVVLFAVLAGYFAVTAAIGWDPVYALTDIDTRAEPDWWVAEPSGDPAGSHVEIDLRDSTAARSTDNRAEGA
jgi:hypothetical protein